MSDLPKGDRNPTGELPEVAPTSEVANGVVKPLSKADPSVAPDWNDHVQEYFNQDAHPGEAVPMATHEAKE